MPVELPAALRCPIPPLGGYRVFANRFLVAHQAVQFRFPRSKRRRIRRKWAKDRRNWRVREAPLENVFCIGGDLHAHPAIIERLGDKIREQTERLVMADTVACTNDLLRPRPELSFASRRLPFAERDLRDLFSLNFVTGF